MRIGGSFVLVAAALALAGLNLLPAAAQTGERRIVETPNADYFGRDYEVLKGVSAESCSAACLEDDRCQAFTLNQTSQWCFLKEAVGELREVEGALSGKVVAATLDENAAEAREADLSFLPRETMDDARRLRLEIEEEARDPGFDGLSPEELAGRAAVQLSYAQAIGLYREALKRSPLFNPAWQGMAESALAFEPDQYAEQPANQALRAQAAVNAFLTAGDEAEAAAALRVLGQAFEKAEDWKSAIKSYRRSLAAAETGETRSLLDAAVASHGFRIVEHTVDNNAASPRVCLVFSEELSSSLTGSETAGDFLSVDGGDTLPVTARGSQICVDGVKHGERYRIVARAGIQSADGERLARPAELDIYVRDRDPSVRFSTNAYVLPAGGEATIPVVTINTDTVEARLQRIGDRALARAVGESKFLRQLSGYEIDEVSAEVGSQVWTGFVDVARETNAEVTTAVPVSAIVDDIKPGVYLLTAKAVNGPLYQDTLATQWFVVTDIGLSTFEAEDGFHVFARSLGTAGQLAGVELGLVAANNQVLGVATTDADGYARFPAGLMRGAGGDRPAVLTAAKQDDDFVFLDLTAAPFDLTDRGVDGRPAVGALDVFLTSERGIYRTGDTAFLTGLVRNSSGEAVEGLTLTGIVTRPDGVEYQRRQVADEGAGGFDWAVELPRNAMRGVWKFSLYTDPERPPLAEKTAIVEDFEPEKLDFDLAAGEAFLDPASPAAIDVEARYLFGAPASNLEVGGEVVLTAGDAIPGFEGYRFGLADEDDTAVRLPFESIATDAEGKATIAVASFEPPATTRPLDATLQVRVLDASGRPVERTLTLPLAGAKPRLGVKPRFEGALGEGSQAGFDVIALDADGERMALPQASWTLNKITTRFQWYSTNGGWNYEPVRSSERIASGGVDIEDDAPASLSLPVEWGEYELQIRDSASQAAPVSVTFEAGWYVAAKAVDTPDIARVSLDRQMYRVGDTAIVHIEPRFAGKVQVVVMDERLIATKTAEIGESGGEVELDVTRDWGPGAYVAAVVYRPMNLAERRMPGRAIGLAYAGVDPGERSLDVSIEAPTKIEPRRSVDVSVAVDGSQAGETAYLTLAAVDAGILNITGFEPPSLSEFFFGKRRLGVAIRDLYSRLIDRMQGAPGAVRSGGDAVSGYAAPPPMEELVALFSGLVTADADGRATVTFDVPDFNGTLQLMALAWTRTGVGEAAAEMVVRDPIVIAVSRPRFMAPGDQSRIAVDITHVEGPTGEATYSLASQTDLVSIEAGASGSLEIGDGARQRLLIPVTALAVGDARFDLVVAVTGGTSLSKSFTLPVRSIAPAVVDKSTIPLAANGGRLALGPDVFSDFIPGTGSATVSVTGAAEFDVAGVVRSLDLYPYGCTEQLVSRALPLLYLDRTILSAGLTGSQDVRERVEKAISGVLANQSSNGGFGLWRPDTGDLWLDAYVTDFLTRAREAGYKVPEEAFGLSIDNLRNSISYLPEQPEWAPVAYAYYVLARNGRAAIGDLRYYTDNELASFKSPLAKAQIAAALVLYGDRVRAETVFRAAVADAVAATGGDEYRPDYGTPLRDGAGVLTLGLEAGIGGVDFEGLVNQVNLKRRSETYTSTQEDTWSLLAANALLERNPPKLQVAGQVVEGAFAASFDADDLEAGPVVANLGDAPVSAEVTLRGVPRVSPPASANGYAIERSYYTLDGEPADPSAIGQGDRLVAVLEVIPVDDAGARLIVDDPLPAGFEIDNPAILRGGDIAALDWLELTGEVAHVEFRADRFVAAVNKVRGDTATMRFAYIVRAVSPGEFVHPAATVEAMYNPDRRGRTDEGHVSVIGARR